MLKKISKAKLAEDFGVKAPSVQDWVNKGTIDKAKLPKLWAYFADVAGPSHWGLASFASEPPPEQPAAAVIAVEAALAALGDALAADMPPEVRQDVADLLHKMAMRRGDTRNQRELARLLGAEVGEKLRPAGSALDQPMSHPAPDDSTSPQGLGGGKREGSGWISNDRRTDPQRTNRSPLDRKQGEAGTGTEGTDQ
ncbi:MAG: hypothetical protein ACT6RP_03185 [Roseateles sp.]|uniref:hypothetical protein n=1 Tax=Roseateles sp. TaxID=1971397 RepID=UPI004037204F